jgi:NADH:ubiquinone oxidoreductase subunit 4 (subunit M)
MASFTCGFQRDVKAFIAYRRVAHINYSTLVVMLLRRGADTCSRVLILRHRLVRGVLFMVAGSCFHYVRRRLMYLLKRVFIMKEGFAVTLILVVLRNLAIPPSLRMVGEVPSFRFGLGTW